MSRFHVMHDAPTSPLRLALSWTAAWQGLSMASGIPMNNSSVKSSIVHAASSTPTNTRIVLAPRYNAGDGRNQKCTIEHVFTPTEDATDAAAPSTCLRDDAASPAAPWKVGWQMSERNLVWHDQLKLRLIKRIASEQLGISEDGLDAKLEEVAVLLPDLADRLAIGSPTWVARLAANTHTIAARMLELKAIMPQANAGRMVSLRLSLLLDEDLQAVRRAVAQLRGLLPGINVDKFIEAFPAVLDVDDFERALEDARRMLPNMDVNSVLRSDPDMILSLQKGKNLIPYDPPYSDEEGADKWSDSGNAP